MRQRERAQSRARPRHRPGHGRAHRVAPRGGRARISDRRGDLLRGARGRLVRDHADVRQPVGGAARARRRDLLRRRLHARAQAPDLREHRHRWCRGRDPSALGMGGGQRSPRRGRVVPVRDRARLDAAALLVAGGAARGSLPGGQGADAAGRQGPRDDRAPGAALHVSDRCGDAAAGGDRYLRRRLRGLGRGARCDLRLLAFRLWRSPTHERAAVAFHYSLLYLALLFVAVAVGAAL